MQSTSKRLLRSVAIAAGVVGLSIAGTGAASAQSAQPVQATLNPLNDQDASGSASVTLDGNKAKVSLSYSGLAKKFQGGPFPHAQHFHIGGNGRCPAPSADENGDGVVSTPEGQPAYGEIGTSLTTKGDTSPDSALAVKRFPGGGSNSYSRTIEVSDATAENIRSGSAVVVVHGLKPSTMSKEAQEAKSPLNPDLPLAATAPALCGVLSDMPGGGVDTGGGATAGVEHGTELAVGAAALGSAAVIGVVIYRRRRSTE